LTGRRDKEILANNCTAKEVNMRRGRVFALILVVLLMTACRAAAIPDGPSFRIQVTGTKGVHFTGSCSYVVSSGYGDKKTRDIKGTVPADYVIVGTLDSCILSNDTDSGLLAVTIVDKNGNVLAQKSGLVISIFGN
jgi:hypothetical protein